MGSIDLNKTVRSPIWAILFIASAIYLYFQYRIHTEQTKSLKSDVKELQAQNNDIQKLVNAKLLTIDTLNKILANKDSLTSSVVIPPKPVYHEIKVYHPVATDSINDLLSRTIQNIY